MFKDFRYFKWFVKKIIYQYIFERNQDWSNIYVNELEGIHELN